jgi:hypothetical protein
MVDARYTSVLRIFYSIFMFLLFCMFLYKIFILYNPFYIVKGEGLPLQPMYSGPFMFMQTLMMAL